MIRVRCMNPQPTRESDKTPWLWCRSGCPDNHDWCVSWRGNRGVLVTDYAPPGPGSCIAAKRKLGVWWWLYRFNRPAKHTCEMCVRWSGMLSSRHGWCNAVRDYTRSTDGPWTEHPDDGCRWRAL
jgi:hypothetical protein